MTTHIALDAARAGMILGAAIKDSDGNMLLPQGIILTDALLASLHRRGIAEVQIDDGLADNVAAPLALPTQQAATARIDFIFRHTSGAASTALRATLLAQALRHTQ
jgi:hypothetical protein